MVRETRTKAEENLSEKELKELLVRGWEIRTS
jgi:hypothetical protein